MTRLFLQQVAVNGHFGHGMADDQDVRWPKAIVLLQTMIEQFETEDVDKGEEQQPCQAFFYE